MSAPQIIILSLHFVTVLLAAHLHGKPRTGRHSFPTIAINSALGLALLYWGGFFSGGAA